MTVSDRLRLGAAFLLAWLSTPLSQVGLRAICVVVLGHLVVPAVIDAIVVGVTVCAGLILIVWPEIKRPPEEPK